jgi:hypothetical protein
MPVGNDTAPLPTIAEGRHTSNLPLPAPEDTGVHAPAPPKYPVLDDPTTMRSAAGEHSEPFEIPTARRTPIVLGLAGAAALIGLITWGMRGSSEDDAGGTEPAPAASPANGTRPRTSPPLVPQPAPDAAPAAAIPTPPLDAAVAPAAPPDAAPVADTVKPKPRRDPKPTPKPKPKPKRKDFEKPVF